MCDVKIVGVLLVHISRDWQEKVEKQKNKHCKRATEVCDLAVAFLCKRIQKYHLNCEWQRKAKHTLLYHVWHNPFLLPVYSLWRH